MPNNDILNRANFGLLEEPGGRWKSFGVSASINLSIMVLLLLFAAAKIHEAKVKREMSVLIVPVDLPKPVKPPVPKVKIVAPPVKLEAKLDPPKIVTPPKIEAPEPPKPVKLDTPKPMPVIPPAPPKAVAPPPAPKAGLFASPKPTEMANNMNKPELKAGGFGDPVGAKANPNSTTNVIAAAGAFNRAPGESSGAGAARKGVVSGASFGAGVVGGVAGGTSHGAVASAGFSNGVVGGTPGGTGHGTVGSAGFGSSGPAKGVQVAMNNAEPAFVPPVVISEPKAQYTSEAQQQHVEGEVTLQVRFLASGQVEVLRVVNGLGHGLDEQARRVAENIHFKPAQKNGQAVDHVTLIHITFQLA